MLGLGARCCGTWLLSCKELLVGLSLAGWPAVHQAGTGALLTLSTEGSAWQPGWGLSMPHRQNMAHLNAGHCGASPSSTVEGAGAGSGAGEGVG